MSEHPEKKLINESELPGVQMENEFVVDREHNGLRLDHYLHLQFSFLSRGAWQKRISGELVHVNDRTEKPSRKLRTGDRIRIQYRKKKEPEVARSYAILYEDSTCMVINKPPGLPLHPSGSYYKNTLSTLLKETYGQNFTVHFVHRIDAETSGVLLIAKSPTYARTYQKSFLNHTVIKEYLVCVEGIFENRVDAMGYLSPDHSSAVRRKRKFTLDAQWYANSEVQKVPPDAGEWESARTEFFPEQILREQQISLIRARIHTGRTHQIRATLQSLGYPVVGDRIYGVDEEIYIRRLKDLQTEEDFKRLRIPRTALHSYRITIPHPHNEKPLVVEAPIPEDLTSLLTQGETNDPIR